MIVRYYEIIDGVAYIYDEPFISNAMSVSIEYGVNSVMELRTIYKSISLERIWDVPVHKL